MFNEICINEEMLPKYIYIFMCFFFFKWAKTFNRSAKVYPPPLKKWVSWKYEQIYGRSYVFPCLFIDSRQNKGNEESYLQTI